MRSPTAALILFLVSLATVFGVDVPSGGTSVFTGSPPAGFSFNGANASRTTVAATGIPHAQAWRIATLADATNRWDIELVGPISRTIATGDMGLIRFYARTVTTTDPFGYGRIAAIIQKNSANWDKSVTVEFYLGTEWKEYFVPFKFATAFASNGSALVFDFGYRKQEVEIAGIELYHYPSTFNYNTLPRTVAGYPGIEEGAPWRTAALARIESIRKGDLSVRVVDTNGNPLPGVSVSVEMTKHHFQFGSALQFERLLTDSPTNRTYIRKFMEIFNSASPENDLKWQPLAGDWGASWTPDRAKRGLQWLANHNVPARGHVMVWPGTRNLPKSIVDLIGTTGQNTIQAKVLQHIDDVSALTQGLVEEWDVQNEPFDNKDLMTALGYDITAEWFKRAREKNPGVRLYLNDYNNENKYQTVAHINADKQIIEVLKNKGAPIDAMGIQAHIGSSGVPPQGLLDTLDDFAALGLDLRITEYDMDTADEDFQAQFTRDFLIACFSHPRMLGVQFWGFWQGAHWIPNGAMFRTDFSEKPQAVEVKKLIHDEWKTRFTANTDADGKVASRGFYGDYIATIDYAGKKVKRAFSHRPGSPAAVEMTVTPPRLANLSTRALAGGTKGPLTVGFFIDGTENKKMLIRGIGPQLAEFGLSSALKKTKLTINRLFNDNTSEVVVTNSGWSVGNDPVAMAAAFTDAGAFGLKSGSLDSAVLVTLAPGRYTAVCDSTDGTSGVALVEAYEMDTNTSTLYNLSTLGYTESGEGVLISGLVVSGRNARTYLIRAVGPTLSGFNVTGVLARPSLTLFKGDKPLFSNTGWEQSPERDRIKTLTPLVGAFGLDDGTADAVMLVTLEPNPPYNYTVQTSGFGDTSGKVLLEIYEVRQ